MNPESYLPISTMEKFAFCRRQAYLHYREREDAENRYIVEGALLHDRVTRPGEENRHDLRQVRSMHLVSHGLGIYGIADVVEWKGNRPPYPVEYKRGRGKNRESQWVQLTLQVLCLEEMLKDSIPEAAIFHGGTRAREIVVIDQKRREHCKSLVRQAHRLLAGLNAPAAIQMPACRRCSLNSICIPAVSNQRVHRYWEHIFD